MTKKDKNFVTNSIHNENKIFVKRYQDLKYNSDYRADENLTEQEYQARLQEIQEIQAKRDKERKIENKKKLEKLEKEYEKL